MEQNVVSDEMNVQRGFEADAFQANHLSACSPHSSTTTPHHSTHCLVVIRFYDT